MTGSLKAEKRDRPCRGFRLHVPFIALPLAIFMLVLQLPGIGSAFSGEYAEFLASRTSSVSPSPDRYQPDTGLSGGKFLIASRDMKDPRFLETVIFLVDYGANGAMGLVINRPTEAKLSRVFPEIEGLKKRTDTLSVGGPVRTDQMFLLIRSNGKPEDSHRVFKDVYISSSKTLLQRMIDEGETAKRFRVYAGYAGWAPRQLDQEVALGGWHVLPADAETIFEKEASQVWPELIRRISLKWVKAGIIEHKKRHDLHFFSSCRQLFFSGISPIIHCEPSCATNQDSPS